MNADTNGAGNTIRKVAPDAFSEARAVEDGKGVLASLVVHPVRLVVVPSRTQKGKSWLALENARDRYTFWNYCLICVKK